MWPPGSNRPTVRLLLACLMAATLASARATEGYVASVQPLATQAGLDALKAGGNASRGGSGAPGSVVRSGFVTSLMCSIASYNCSTAHAGVVD